jgi:hypothetical protein
MDKNVKIALWVGGSVVVAVITYYIIKWIRERIADPTTGVKVDESNLSANKADYNLWASQLYTAMDGAGTETDTIYRVLKNIETQDDWNQLIKAFGVKESTSWFSSFKGTLVDWLSDELSVKEKDAANQILARAGVTI